MVGKTKDLDFEDFSCRCGCGANDTSVVLILKLQEVVGLAGRLKINSGTRCIAHNEEVGGAKQSFHLTGHAADIKAVESGLIELYMACERVGFPGLIWSGDHVHVDIGDRVVRGHKAQGKYCYLFSWREG